MVDEVAAHGYCLVLVSSSSELEATAIATALVQERLAACVSIMPVTSTYLWQGNLQHGQEWQLLVKTTEACFETLQKRVMDLHSYEVPEIIAIPIQAGSAVYLGWVGASVTA